jgi:hypothetical protein
MAQTTADRLKRRLKGVRKRKQAHSNFACETLQVKMKLVRRKRRKK